jgi:5'-3' exonuclease
MINILCDGNYVLHKTFGVFAGYGNVDPGKVFSKKSDQAMFIRKVATDLCSSLNSLPSGGRLIFTADSKSWRREIEIENGGYKSNRTKDENVDWSIFFELMDSFGRQLEKMGFIYSKVTGAEGDDLLYMWSKHFNNNGEDCIVLSGDKDLHQLARFEGSNWTITWNSNNKKNVVTTPIGWKSNWLEKEEEASIFNMGSVISPDKGKLKTLLSKCELNEVDRELFVLNKMFVGDKGDAVPSVWEIRQNGKTMGFTAKKSEALIEAMNASEEWKNIQPNELLNSSEFLNWASGFILRSMKDVDSSENRNKVSYNIRRNYKLMWLDATVLPNKVVSDSEAEIERGISLERKSITLDRIKILEGTNWIAPNYSPSSFDPFANL